MRAFFSLENTHMSRLHLEAIMRNVPSWHKVSGSLAVQDFEKAMMHCNLAPEETIAAWEWFLVGWVVGASHVR